MYVDVGCVCVTRRVVGCRSAPGVCACVECRGAGVELALAGTHASAGPAQL